jgi:hypothetical protein
MKGELELGITAERKSDYVMRSYGLCLNPKCDSGNIEGGDIQMDGMMAWQEITCLDCGVAWDDVYELQSVEVTHIPEEVTDGI